MFRCERDDNSCQKVTGLGVLKEERKTLHAMIGNQARKIYIEPFHKS